MPLIIEEDKSCQCRPSLSIFKISGKEDGKMADFFPSIAMRELGNILKVKSHLETYLLLSLWTQT